MAKENNFFAPTFSADDMDQLPGLYRTIIEDPAAVHDLFVKAEGNRLNLLRNKLVLMKRSHNACVSYHYFIRIV